MYEKSKFFEQPSKSNILISWSFLLIYCLLFEFFDLFFFGFSDCFGDIGQHESPGNKNNFES